MQGHEVYAVLRSRIARVLHVDEDGIAPTTSLVDDLDADSLDLVELMLDLKEEFGIDIDDRTTRDLLRSGVVGGFGDAAPATGEGPDAALRTALGRLTVGDVADLLCLRLGVPGA